MVILCSFCNDVTNELNALKLFSCPHCQSRTRKFGKEPIISDDMFEEVKKYLFDNVAGVYDSGTLHVINAKKLLKKLEIK